MTVAKKNNIVVMVVILAKDCQISGIFLRNRRKIFRFQLQMEFENSFIFLVVYRRLHCCLEEGLRGLFYYIQKDLRVCSIIQDMVCVVQRRISEFLSVLKRKSSDVFYIIYRKVLESALLYRSSFLCKRGRPRRSYMFL